MDKRIELARELQEACLVPDFKDICAIISALRRGESRNFILSELPELKRWPEAFDFLSDRL